MPKQNLLCMANIIKLYAPYYNDIRRPWVLLEKKIFKGSHLGFFSQKAPYQKF